MMTDIEISDYIHTMSSHLAMKKPVLAAALPLILGVWMGCRVMGSAGHAQEAVRNSNDSLKLWHEQPVAKCMQAFGDLKVEFQLPDRAVTNYRRWRDIDSALATRETFNWDGH